MKYHQNISQEEWEEIEGYLSGQMSAEGKKNFENRLSADAALREKLNETRLLLTGIRENALQDELEGFHQQMAKAPPLRAKKISMRSWMAAAAVVLVAAVISILLMNRSTKNEQLFAEYFEHDPGLATAMGSSENYAFDRGMIDYRMEKYQSAIDAWRKLEAAAPANDTLQYFLGQAFLALHDADSAVQHFERTLALPGDHFRSDAHWYLSLALLSENKKQEALKHLQQTGHPRKDELLSQLK